MMVGRKVSILRKILIPILVLMSLQAGLIFGFIIFGGTISQIEENSFDILGEKVSNRSNMLETEMIQRWSSMDEAVNSAQDTAERVLARNGKTVADLEFQDPLSVEILNSLSRNILYLIRKNGVTGAFIILNGNENDRKSGLYFRDSDLDSDPSNYSDLLAERAPSSVTKELGIAMDSYWQPYFSFDGTSGQNYDFFSKPFSAALAKPELSYTDLGYWCPTFNLNGEEGAESSKVITYSVPLRDKKGTPFGVLGVSISEDHLEDFIPSQELSEGNKDGYLLAVGNLAEMDAPQQEYELQMHSGAFFHSLASKKEMISFEKEKGEFYRLTSGIQSDHDIYGAIHPIQLYNTNTPFESEQWVLIGAVSEDQLLEFSSRFLHMILMSWVLTTAIGVLGICLVARRITRPIQGLSVKLEEANRDSQISLKRIGIAEIDELLDSIEYQSKQASDAAFRLKRIMDTVGVNVAAFEYRIDNSDRVFCTANLFEMLGISGVTLTGNYMSTDQFEETLSPLSQYREEPKFDQAVNLYRLEIDGKLWWVKMQCIHSDEGTLGVFSDVTQEMLDKKKIEYDRDYDLLTTLLNRRAFYAQLKVLFSQPARLKTAALIMMDLDDLKYINDTYGHDYGDEYLRSFGALLRKYTGEGSVISRLSGDEFVVLFYGYEDKDKIRQICSNIQMDMRQSQIYMADLSRMQIRASAGISWYPDDSERYGDLVRYADFAMYMVKKSRKGEFTEFDIRSYNENAYLLHCREELNTLIEGNLVDYQFQPIVDAVSGDVFAFEALIRPRSEHIRTPDELLSLARTQSKLAQIEKLTFFNALESFSKKSVAVSGCKLFVNSISNQIMSDADAELFKQKYKPYLDRIVVEITEMERPEEELTMKKQGYVEVWNAQLALDDFGVGYSGESFLLQLQPHYIKIDMSLIRDIHLDKDRLQLLKNLIAYSRERGVKVIAEGIECKEELEVVVREGVDYLQGYYLGRPVNEPSLNLGTCKNEILAISRSIEWKKRIF